MRTRTYTHTGRVARYNGNETRYNGSDGDGAARQGLAAGSAAAAVDFCRDYFSLGEHANLFKPFVEKLAAKVRPET